MKNRFSRPFNLALLTVVFPMVGGCVQETNPSSPNLLGTAVAQPAVQTPAETNVFPVAGVVPITSGSDAEAASEPITRPEPAGAALAGKVLPPSIQPSSPVAEVVKLAQGGVDESVILTYITNSTTPFGLRSEEIIYLKDIGVPDDVINTMIQHDQTAKQFWANAAAAQTAAAAPVATGNVPTEQTAAAPSYVEAPQPASAEPQPTVVNNNYFYDTLSPYGSWVNVEGYGLCWQPTVVVVNRNWRPYCDGGRWLYTDNGWYWYSDYTWGWAPFHYGRWFSHPRWGWCWYPGYTWGPAWVTWRYTDGYCGWAPLPPGAYYSAGIGFTYYGGSVGFSFGFGLGYNCYTFVPWNNFCGYRPYKYCASPYQARDIYNSSTVVNNYINGNNNTIINGGIPRDQVASRSRQEVRQVAVRESTLASKSGRGERLDAERGTLAVHRPQLPQEQQLISSPARSEASRAETRRSLDNGSAGAAKSQASGMSLAPADRTSVAKASVDTRPPRVESRAVESRTVSPESRLALSDREVAAAAVKPAEVSASSPSLPTNPESSGRPERALAERSAITPMERREAGVRTEGNVSVPQTSPRPAVSSEVKAASPAKAPIPAVAAASPPPANTASRSSVVLIGNKGGGQSRGSSYSVWSSPQNPPTQPQASAPTRAVAPSPVSPQSPPAVTKQVVPPSVPAPQREETSRVAPSSVGRSGGKSVSSSFATPSPSVAPPVRSYSPPPSAPRPSPSYNAVAAPPTRSAPAYSKPVYSPPVTAPAPSPRPSYSPPVSSPSPSSPSPASPSRSEFGPRARR